MIKCREFLCPQEHLFDDLVEDGVVSVRCPTCHNMAQRIMSAFSSWDRSPAATKEKLKRRSQAHSLTKNSVDEARHQLDKAMGKIQRKLGV